MELHAYALVCWRTRANACECSQGALGLLWVLFEQPAGTVLIYRLAPCLNGYATLRQPGVVLGEYLPLRIPEGDDHKH